MLVNHHVGLIVNDDQIYYPETAMVEVLVAFYNIGVWHHPEKYPSNQRA